MTTYTVWQTEDGGHISTSYASTIPATSGYAFFVGKGIQYRIDGFLASGNVYISRSGISNLPVGKYEMLPQVIDASNRVYFLTTADVEVEKVLGASQTAFASGDTLLNRISTLESASRNYALFDAPNTFTASQIIAPTEDSVALTVRAKALPSFPSVMPLDDFNRADAGLGPDWTSISGVTAPTIVSNRATSGDGSSGTYYEAYYNAAVFDDFDITIDLAALQGVFDTVYGEISLYLRFTPNPLSGYMFWFYGGDGTAPSVRVYNLASFTPLASAAPLGYVPINGDRIGVRLQGDSFTVYGYHGSTWLNITTVSDDAHASGYAALSLSNGIAGLAVDNFSAATIASQTENLLEAYDAADDLPLRLSSDGYIIIATHAAPADADLSAGECALWFDQTNGAAKLKIKAKQANGTVKTGEVTLS